jgi:hypothetical protein
MKIKNQNAKCKMQNAKLQSKNDNRAVIANPNKVRVWQSYEILRGACPERHEILRFAQNDRKRRA